MVASRKEEKRPAKEHLVTGSQTDIRRLGYTWFEIEEKANGSGGPLWIACTLGGVSCRSDFTLNICLCVLELPALGFSCRI